MSIVTGEGPRSFILDTNVISEVMKPVPSKRVVTWITSQPATALFTTTITLAEVLYFLELVPAGKRRNILRESIETMFDKTMAGRVLSFDQHAARAFAQILAVRRAMGKPIGELNGQIAAIAQTRGAVIATRNTRDFRDCGVEVTDPFL